MNNSLKKYAFLLNDFSHDLFTGLWICSLLAIYLINGAVQEHTSPETVAFATGLLRVFFNLLCFSMVLIMATGGARYYHVRRSESAANTPERRKLLIAKHAVMGVLFPLGTWLGWVWSSITP